MWGPRKPPTPHQGFWLSVSEILRKLGILSGLCPLPDESPDPGETAWLGIAKLLAAWWDASMMADWSLRVILFV